jgi:tRNA(fMet)-specific endonuclease VapC
MILLDTDHLSVLINRNASGHSALVSRLESASEPAAVPIVGVEEQCKGWLAKISRTRHVDEQVPAYDQLIHLFRFFREWQIVPFDSAAADTFKQLRQQKIRIGSRDLKIAAIALTRDALLLSANLGGFRKVPCLRVENWLHR